MDSKKRFSNRVENYIKYRPSYPKEAINFLYVNLGFNEKSIIADIGSGTGIFTKLLLERGSKVVAIEPNKEMRNAAEVQLNEHHNFVSINGTAEDTQLEVQSVDYIVSAQSFHWFDRRLAKIEFSRILRPSGKVILIWNNRRTDQNAIDRAYENLLSTYGKDYAQVRHTNINENDLRAFFKDGIYTKKSFENHQDFDFDGLSGRMLSSSYIPMPDETNHNEMMEKLKIIFNEYNESGKVTIAYDTEIYYGEA
ncbi:MAG: methyltransferase [Bacilli bacterium]|nr:methyltransferase [Bacilli bacterium]